MSNLKAFLQEASKAYYAGTPFIPDEVFDRLADIIDFNEVGSKQHSHIEQHYYRMWSLQKFYEGEDKKRPLTDYNKRTVRTPKLDGAAISLLYVGGSLVRANTRGDGIEGTDILNKVLTLDKVPQNIPFSGLMQVTGEVVAPKEIANARNYAAGALNLKNIEEFQTRNVQFIAYGVQVEEAVNPTYIQDMLMLEEYGFRTIFEPELHNVYPCDGIVVRVDDNADFVQMGFTSSFPKGAYAAKERQEAIETKLIGVEWNTGRTGRVTPVAILEPILIGEATISRATLNNPGFIEALGLAIGDTVGVVRSGEIIPMIAYRADT